MNSNSAVTTGAIAVSAGMLASIIVWLAGLAHVSMPPEVSGALAALILWAAHGINERISAPRVPPPANPSAVHMIRQTPTETAADK